LRLVLVVAQEEEDRSSGASSSAIPDDDEETTSLLWCSGDAPNSAQQQAFEGVWRLCSISHVRAPAYEHVAPDGTLVYLFFVEQPAAESRPQLCRWVIGPRPEASASSGWAYSDSKAERPEDVVEPWSAWDKERGEWLEARLAFSAKAAVLGQETGEGEDEDLVFSAGEESGAESGAEGGGAAVRKKKGAKKRAGGKGGKAKKGGESKAKAAAARRPTAAAVKAR
jgi:hypothetical protein